MDRLKGLASFFFVAAAVFVTLRLINVGIPVFYPKVLSGPFSLDRVAAVAEYTGFSPRLPFYHPQTLGSRPVNITVTRRPYPKVVIFWNAERFLYLAEQQGGKLARPASEGEPFPGRPDALHWQEGATHTVILELDELAIELRTDLSLQDVQRMIDTLRPYEQLL